MTSKTPCKEDYPYVYPMWTRVAAIGFLVVILLGIALLLGAAVGKIAGVSQ